MSGPEGFPPNGLIEMREHRRTDTIVLSLLGELDLGTAVPVQQRLAELRDARQAVVLDLDGLTFMDSTGIRLVLSACEDALERDWSFHVTRGSERVRHVLKAAQVIDRLPYDDDSGR